MAKISAYGDGGSPQDTDDFVVARSGVNKRLTWANIVSAFNSLFVALTGDQNVAGVKTFSSFPITPSSAPTTDYQVANKKYVDDNGGSGGLTYSAQTITTGNISAANGFFYDCTIAGMTADRDFNLPTPSAAGERIALRVLDGDDTYELIIKANSVEITRVFIAGEYMSFVSTGTGAGDWSIEIDKRIPCRAVFTRITTPYDPSHAAGVWALMDWNNLEQNTGSCGNLTNDRFNVRRANKYKSAYAVAFSDGIPDGEYGAAGIFKNGSASGSLVQQATSRQSTAGGASSNIFGLIPEMRATALVVGDYLDWNWRTQTADIGIQNTDATSPSLLEQTTYWEVYEVLQ